MAISFENFPSPYQLNQTRERPISRSEYLQLLQPGLEEKLTRKISKLSKKLIFAEVLRNRSADAYINRLKQHLMEQVSIHNDSESLTQAVGISVLDPPDHLKKSASAREESLQQHDQLQGELNQLKTLSPAKFAETTYFVERIQQDLDARNINELKAWIQIAPSVFAKQPQFILQALELINNSQDADFLHSLVLLFVGWKDAIKDSRVQTGIIGRLQSLFNLSIREGTLPLTDAILNTTKKPILSEYDLDEALQYGITSGNEELIALVIRSKQASLIRSYTLKKIYHSINSKLVKVEIEKLWLKRRSDLNDLVSFKSYLSSKINQQIDKILDVVDTHDQRFQRVVGMSYLLTAAIGIAKVAYSYFASRD